MNKPSRPNLRPSKEVVACCALAFVAACTGQVGSGSSAEPGERRRFYWVGHRLGRGERLGVGRRFDHVGQRRVVNLRVRWHHDDHGQRWFFGRLHGRRGGGGAGVPEPPALRGGPGFVAPPDAIPVRELDQDVLGVDVDTTLLDADSFNGDFAVVGATTVVSSDLAVEQYQTAVEAAVNAVFADTTKRNQVIGCTPSAAQNDSCTKTLHPERGATGVAAPPGDRRGQRPGRGREHGVQPARQRHRRGPLGGGGDLRLAELHLSRRAGRDRQQRADALHRATRWPRGCRS